VAVRPCRRPAAIANGITLTELSAVTVDEVEVAIKKLSNKSSPLDLLPVSLLKLCLPEIVYMITNLANASFKSGRFPAQIKLGQITPLLKKAGLDAADDSNFRPITNLSTMSKLLERLALARLQPHLLRSHNYCIPYNLPIDPYIPLRLLCSRSPTTYTGQWITAPSLLWSASIFPLRLTLWTTVFFPVVSV